MRKWPGSVGGWASSGKVALAPALSESRATSCSVSPFSTYMYMHIVNACSLAKAGALAHLDARLMGY